MLLNVVYICEIRLKPMTHRRIYMKTKHIKMLYIVVYATLDSNSLIVGYEAFQNAFYCWRCDFLFIVVFLNESRETA